MLKQFAILTYSLKNICLISCLFNFNFLSLQRLRVVIMSYTKEPIVIDNPSEKLLKTIKKLREHKLAEVEKLRNMKPEEFSCRIIL